MPDLDLAEFMPEPPCLVAARLAKLSEDDRLLFEAALAHPDVKTTRIVERFAVRGVSIGKDVVGRHRKGACACARAS